MFIYHIHPILQRQQIDYAIYVVEQAGSGKFNRAMLMNVGALEALKQYPYDCFIFHDVDLLPEDDRNLYTCPEQPRHMSIAIDSMGYKLPYNDIFGGVSAMTADQFRTVNGFSNKFWGWGGEDDDMSNRIKFHGFFISRYPANIGRYTMLSHKKDEPNPRRYHYLYDGKKRFKSDGLNSVKYRTLDLQLRRLYTWVYVDLYPS
ncbi:beta-1,4-N-acetylgalactosaminyltransferase bre-4-like [Penaeus chinensis]|nr:beta-1,4-N-acetylgalactosaminyltransferase bre-4-like [Penaeus chinensis]